MSQRWSFGQDTRRPDLRRCNQTDQRHFPAGGRGLPGRRGPLDGRQGLLRLKHAEAATDRRAVELLLRAKGSGRLGVIIASCALHSYISYVITIQISVLFSYSIPIQPVFVSQCVKLWLFDLLPFTFSIFDTIKHDHVLYAFEVFLLLDICDIR